MQIATDSTSVEILLPKEMWSTVFSYLPNNELRKIELVSRSLFAALHAHIKKEVTSLWTMGLKSGHSAVKFAIARQLPFVLLDYCSEVDNQLVAKLSKKCLNLQQLSLKHPQISDVTCIGQLTNLKQLSLCYTKISNLTGLIGLNSLQQLNLSTT